ncbi:MAG: response regulator [Desulfobacteraceae bacterium]|nr:response regulator [Desulfobacteraceae bacterium]
MNKKLSYDQLESYVKILEDKVYKSLRTEQINKTLFNIATSLSSSSSLQDLYTSIHKILADLMDMTNFYIAIYYKNKNAIRFVYYVDTEDIDIHGWIENFTQDRSLTGDVILAKAPLFLREDQLIELSKKGRIKGLTPKIWIGVPLMIKGDVLGVMAVQSYTNPKQFNESDAEVLSFVSDQIAVSIEKKKSEELLKKTQEQLIQSEKLEAIGTLAGGIAHDFNNTLAITLGSINLAQMLSNNSELDDTLSDAETSVMQAKALASKFIVFSKGGISLKKQIFCKEFIQTALESISEEKKIKYHLQIGNVPEKIEADPQQLKEALKNVVLNAHEAMGKKEAVSIVFRPHQTKNDYVVISVVDKGKGIENKVLEKVFEPYYSTKSLGKDKGIGLGMSIAYSIIQNHKGDIHITSTPQKGTKVDIILPISQKEDAQKTAHNIVENEASSQKANENNLNMVLVMDDDKMIRGIYAKILKKLGYEAILSKNGEQAIQVYKKHLEAGEKINTAILDLEVKQGMGGAETIKKLLKMNPEIKAIIASGYSSDMVMENCQDYGFSLALNKPFSIETLKVALEKLQ